MFDTTAAGLLEDLTALEDVEDVNHSAFDQKENELRLQALDMLRTKQLQESEQAQFYAKKVEELMQ